MYIYISEFILLLKLDKQFPVGRLEAAASQSAVVSMYDLYTYNDTHIIIL